jgi:hypothetical protein
MGHPALWLVEEKKNGGGDVICGGLVGSLEWKMLLLRLEWRATGALVFD